MNREESTNPKFWSKVCLHNMAKLAKEATTVRRIFESLFRYFDNEDLWSPLHGVAISVLLDMQWIVENSGAFSFFCLDLLNSYFSIRCYLSLFYFSISP